MGAGAHLQINLIFHTYEQRGGPGEQQLLAGRTFTDSQILGKSYADAARQSLVRPSFLIKAMRVTQNKFEQ